MKDPKFYEIMQQFLIDSYEVNERGCGNFDYWEPLMKYIQSRERKAWRACSLTRTQSEVNDEATADEWRDSLGFEQYLNSEEYLKDE